METIKELSEQIIKLGEKPNLDNEDQKGLIKELSKQLEQLSVKSIFCLLYTSPSPRD